MNEIMEAERQKLIAQLAVETKNAKHMRTNYLTAMILFIVNTAGLVPSLFSGLLGLQVFFGIMSVGCLVFWIVFLSIYVHKTNTVRDLETSLKAYETPVAPK